MTFLCGETGAGVLGFAKKVGKSDGELFAAKKWPKVMGEGLNMLVLFRHNFAFFIRKGPFGGKKRFFGSENAKLSTALGGTSRNIFLIMVLK